MNKIRIYEIAKELGLDNKELVAKVASLGIEVRNHMTALDPLDADRVRRAMEKEKSENLVEERIRPGVVKRRVIGGPSASTAVKGDGVRAASSVTPTVTAREAIAARGDTMGKVDALAPPVRAVVRRAPQTPPPPAIEEAPAARVSRVPTPPPPAAEEVATPEVREAAKVAVPESAPPAPVAAHVEEAAPVAVEPTVEPTPPARAERPAPVETPEVESAPPPVVEAPSAVVEAPPVQERPAAAAVVEGPPVSTAAAAPTAAPTDGGHEAPIAVAQPIPLLSPTGRPLGPAARLALERAAAGLPPRTEPPPPAGQRPGSVPPPPPPRRTMLERGVNFTGPTGRDLKKQGKKKVPPSKKVNKPEITIPKAQKRVIRIEEQVGLQALAQRMSVKATDVLMKLLQMGMPGVNINTNLDADTAKIIASEFGYEVEDVATSDEEQVTDARPRFDAAKSEARLRPPIVTVMGHVDHGKTSLLDRIRAANVAAGEAGGITQHIGAYRVSTVRGDITFLDTPGHEAFTAMRARGAQITDVVILVVAADDGVMPQTREAIHHAQAAGVPIVVAVNKIDKPDARPDVIKRDLANEGLQPEDWGGTTIFCEVSAKTGQGIERLLEMVALQAEVLELRAAPEKPAEGVVVEGRLDRGRGPVATILVRDGTLKTGDVVLCGTTFGKVRAMSNDRFEPVAEAGPATPVEVLGLNAVPGAGDAVFVVADMKKAQQIADSRVRKVAQRTFAPKPKVSLEDLYKRLKEDEETELRLVIKADTQGSVEAIAKSLTDLATEKVKVTIIHSGVGAITEGDVSLASASGAIVIGFTVRPAGNAAAHAKKDNVDIRLYSIIYEVVDDVKKAMQGLLAPTYVEKALGKAEVRQVFQIPKIGLIGGSFVVDGVIKRSALARVVRDSAVVWEGKIGSLRRFKEDAREVAAGYECGIGLEGMTDLKQGDVVEAFEMEEVAAPL
ncbi:MAG: translation initiation factor IF-2 [Deltaproteobacteria bacterium]|nr:translation initiation factor IF-2 [Deltaproteobacteria bacterium]